MTEVLHFRGVGEGGLKDRGSAFRGVGEREGGGRSLKCFNCGTCSGGSLILRQRNLLFAQISLSQYQDFLSVCAVKYFKDFNSRLDHAKTHVKKLYN